MAWMLDDVASDFRWGGDDFAASTRWSFEKARSRRDVGRPMVCTRIHRNSIPSFQSIMYILAFFLSHSYHSPFFLLPRLPPDVPCCVPPFRGLRCETSERLLRKENGWPAPWADGSVAHDLVRRVAMRVASSTSTDMRRWQASKQMNVCHLLCAAF